MNTALNQITALTLSTHTRCHGTHALLHGAIAFGLKGVGHGIRPIVQIIHRMRNLPVVELHDVIARIIIQLNERALHEQRLAADGGLMDGHGVADIKQRI